MARIIAKMCAHSQGGILKNFPPRFWSNTRHEILLHAMRSAKPPQENQVELWLRHERARPFVFHRRVLHLRPDAHRLHRHRMLRQKDDDLPQVQKRKLPYSNELAERSAGALAAIIEGSRERFPCRGCGRGFTTKLQHKTGDRVKCVLVMFAGVNENGRLLISADFCKSIQSP